MVTAREGCSGAFPRGGAEAGVEQHRRELRVHCYRMAGSVDEAEDLVDETFRRARAQVGPGARGPSGARDRDDPAALRAWLHRLATTVCIETLADRSPRLLPHDLEPALTGVGMGFGTAELVPRADIAWLQPIPEHLWRPDDPADAAAMRSTIAVPYVAALQHLPPRKRAILLMRDVLGCPTRHIADYLALTEASVAATLRRARQVVRDRLPGAGADPRRASETDVADEAAVARRYMDAVDRADRAALAEVLAEDVRASLPPWTIWLDGRAAVLASLGETWDPRSPYYLGDFRTRPTSANGQPAVATYRRGPDDDTAPFRAFAVTVLRVESDHVAEIIGFHEPTLFPTFHLPITLPPG